MRDFPFFTTQYGVASLILNQVPYTSTAYIRIQSASDGEMLLKECVDFCCAVGADRIYATGHSVCEQYIVHTQIIKMSAGVSTVGDTDAALFPVTEQTIKKWREIYNQKIRAIPNASYMTIKQAQTYFQECAMYFVHRDDLLLGIGLIDGNEIRFLASVHPGAGEDVVRGLCHCIMDEFVTLEVASTNIKAVNLYEKLGFIKNNLLVTWYEIKK